MIQISKASDLLKAAPLIEVLRNSDNEIKALQLVEKAITKCAMALGISMMAENLQLLASDLIERYQHDSLEDIIYSLKMGRQGMYGFEYHNRSNLNMQLLSDWMGKTLEAKAEAREKELKNLNYDKEPLPNVDYANYLAVKKVADKIEEEEKAKEDAYQKYRAKYFAGQNKQKEE